MIQLGKRMKVQLGKSSVTSLERSKRHPPAHTQTSQELTQASQAHSEKHLILLLAHQQKPN